MREIKLYTAADILAYDFEAERDEQIRIEDGYIVFVNQHYDIELERCASKAQILEWVHHLLGKNWMTVDLLDWFIELATQYHKINIYDGGA